VPRDTLSVITLNVLFGGEERMDLITSLLHREQPDLVILQECLGWEDGERLRQVAKAIDATDVHLGRARARASGNRYHVGIASRVPLLFARTHNDAREVGHCIVEFAIPFAQTTLHGFATHFDASSEDLRLKDARKVNSLAAGPAEGFALLAGDLNALSPRDPYPPDFDARLVAAATDKYGHPARFDVIRTLEAFGWSDTLHATSPEHWVTAHRDRGGVPIDTRTDYVFVSPRLLPHLLRARVVDTHGASDHNAVAATFSLTNVR
jgi:exodeoxyribonuclease-3